MCDKTIETLLDGLEGAMVRLDMAQSNTPWDKKGIAKCVQGLKDARQAVIDKFKPVAVPPDILYRS